MRRRQRWGISPRAVRVRSCWARRRRQSVRRGDSDGDHHRGHVDGQYRIVGDAGGCECADEPGSVHQRGADLERQAGGLNVTGTVNGGTGAVSITTAGGALALASNNVSGAGVSLTGVGVTSTGGTVNGGSGTILVDGNDGAINLAGALTTTNATATAVRIIDANGGALGISPRAVRVRSCWARRRRQSVRRGDSDRDHHRGHVDGQYRIVGDAGGCECAHEPGAFTSVGLTLNDSAGGLNVTGTVNGGTGAVSITTAGGALALASNNVSGAGVSLTGVGVTSTGGTVNGGSGTILVDGNDGAINLAGALTTTNATATAVRIIDATTAALGISPRAVRVRSCWARRRRTICRAR